MLGVNEPSATVSDLTFQLGSGVIRTGLALNGARAVRVTADGNPGAVESSIGISVFGGATVRDSRALLPNASSNAGVSVSSNVGDTSTVEDVEATGYLGVNASPAGTVNIRRVHVHDSNQGVRAAETGTVNVSSSLIRVSGPFARALIADSAFGATPVLNARHVTAIGDGGADSHGADSYSTIAARTTTVNVRESILRGFEHALFREATFGTAHLSVSYSDYDPAGVTDTGPGGFNVGPGNVNVDPAFIGPGSGDFRLRADSPLVDAGDPAAARRAGLTDGPRQPPAGGRRQRRRRGAERHRGPRVPASRRPGRPGRRATLPAPAGDTTRPVLAALSLSRTVFRAGAKSTPVGARRKRAPRGTTVRFRLSEPAAVRLAMERRSTGRRVTRRGKRVCVGGPGPTERAALHAIHERAHAGPAGPAGRNAVTFTGRIRGRTLAAGRYRMRLVATDAAGNRSSSRTVAFRIVR